MFRAASVCVCNLLKLLFASFSRCCFETTSPTVASWVIFVSLFVFSSFFFFLFVLFVLASSSLSSVFFLRKRDASRRLSKCACRDRLFFSVGLLAGVLPDHQPRKELRTVSWQLTCICNYSLAQALHVASKFSLRCNYRCFSPRTSV